MATELLDIFESCGRKFSTDSRKITGGELFFALKGENFDGNIYASKALEDGAAWAVVEKGSQKFGDPRFIEVEDTLKALQNLARDYRRTLRIPFVALTGTNGKTTTKELISAVLRTKYRTASTLGNLNNDIGVPLTVLGIKPDDEIAVIEMGANHPWDIQTLVEVAEPDFGLITNVGKAHLLGFGSLEGVKAAKGALYDYLAKNGGTAFLNDKDPVLCDMAAQRKGMKIETYALDTAILYDNDSCCLEMSIDGVRVNTNLIGSYNESNVCAAIAVGRHFSVSEEDAIRAIEAYEPSNSRSQMIRTGRNTIVLDAYNANPSSMNAALDNFESLKSGNKIAMIGEMLELGEDSVKEHIAIMKKAFLGNYRTIFVGGEFLKAKTEASLTEAEVFPSSAVLSEQEWVKSLSGATVLLKGSRGTRMETVKEVL